MPPTQSCASRFHRIAAFDDQVIVRTGLVRSVVPCLIRNFPKTIPKLANPVLPIGQPIKNTFRRPNRAPTAIPSWRPVLPDEVATASFPPPRVRGRRARHESRFHVPVAVVSPFLPSPLTQRTDASGLASDNSLASAVLATCTLRTSKLGGASAASRG